MSNLVILISIAVLLLAAFILTIVLWMSLIYPWAIVLGVFLLTSAASAYFLMKKIQISKLKYSKLSVIIQKFNNTNLELSYRLKLSRFNYRMNFVSPDSPGKV